MSHLCPITRFKGFYLVVWFLISLLFIVFGRYLCTSLWFDETWLMGAIDSNPTFKSFYLTTLYDHQMPLFFFTEFFWYQIIPKEELWIRIPSILFTAAGMVTLLKFGHKHSLCVIPFLLAFVSVPIIHEGAFNARPYGLYFLGSALALYTRYESKDWRYALSLLILSLSHWFGLMLCCIYGVVDFFEFLRRMKWRFKELLVTLLPYLALIPAFIWLMLTILYNGGSLLYFYHTIPTPSVVLSIIKDICGGWINLILFLIGCIISVTAFVKRRDKMTPLYVENLFAIIVMFASSYIYSRYINPKGAFYDCRYFIGAAPQIYAIIALAIISIANVKAKSVFEKIIKPAVYLLFAALIISKAVTLYVQYGEYDQYCSIAKYISEDEELTESRSSLILLSGDIEPDSYVTKGFLSFYFSLKNRHLPENVARITYFDRNPRIITLRHNSISVHTDTTIEELDYDTILLIGKDWLDIQGFKLPDKYIIDKEIGNNTIYRLEK